MPAVAPLILSLAASNISLAPSTTSTSIVNPILVQRGYPDWTYDWPAHCKLKIHSATPSPCPGAFFTSVAVEYECRFTETVLVPYSLPPPGEPVEYLATEAVDPCEGMPEFYPMATIADSNPVYLPYPGRAAVENLDPGSGSSLGPVTQTHHGNEKRAPTPALAAPALPAATDCEMYPLREIWGGVRRTITVTVTKTTGAAYGQSQTGIITVDGQW